MKRLTDTIGSTGVMLLLIPVVIIVLFGVINFAVYGVPVEDPNYKLESVSDNWFIEGLYVVFHWALFDNPASKAIGVLFNYLSLNIPLVTAISPYDIPLRAVMYASMLIGIVEIVWL
jgi:hypothetical protein